MKRFTKPIYTLIALIITITALILIAIHSQTGIQSYEESNLQASVEEVIREMTNRTSKMPQVPQAMPVNVGTNGAVSLPAVSTSDQSLPVNVNASAQPVINDTRATEKHTGIVALIDSPVAEKWLKEEGITRADIETAQSRLRDNGFPARMQEDPSLVRQYLPRRNIQAAHIRSFIITDKAKAGQSIPFSMGGALPDSSFQFTHFDISQSSNVIRILPIGNTSGEAAPGEEIPVNLDGELGPLAPGIYHIEFPELGTDGSYRLTVE